MVTNKEDIDFYDLTRLNDISLFEHLKYVGPDTLIIMFHTSNCPPCERMKPIFARSASRAGWAERFFSVVHKGDAPETIASLGITLFPSFAIFRNMQCVGIRQGSMPLQELERYILLT